MKSNILKIKILNKKKQYQGTTRGKSSIHVALQVQIYIVHTVAMYLGKGKHKINKQTKKSFTSLDLRVPIK